MSQRKVSPTKHSCTERSVDFRNPTGKTLRGVLHLPPSVTRHSQPGVVFFHGFTGDRMESHWIFVKCARALAQAGIAALRFDFYGSGESDGEFREVSLRNEIADARAAVQYFRAQPEIHPSRVGLLGISLGGTIAAVLADSLKAKAAVLWSAVAHTSRLRELLKKLTRKVPNKPGALEYKSHELSPRIIEDILKVEPVRHLARYKGPTLIIHPGADEVVPVTHARHFHQAAGAEAKELVIIPEADHVFTSVPWEQEVIAHTVQWFVRHL